MFQHYGNGEIGDDGIHDLDMACWGLGVTTLPRQITARGSRMLLDGHALPHKKKFLKSKFSADPATAGAAHDNRLDAREFSFRTLRVSQVQLLTDEGAQQSVTEKLQPLIRPEPGAGD